MAEKRDCEPERVELPVPPSRLSLASRLSRGAQLEEFSRAQLEEELRREPERRGVVEELCPATSKLDALAGAVDGLDPPLEEEVRPDPVCCVPPDDVAAICVREDARDTAGEGAARDDARYTAGELPGLESPRDAAGEGPGLRSERRHSGGVACA